MNKQKNSRELKIKLRSGEVYNFQVSADATPAQISALEKQMRLWLNNNLHTLKTFRSRKMRTTSPSFMKKNKPNF